MGVSVALKQRIRLMAGDTIAFGPGKADLLDAIRATGSISAAARQLGMSYRRAWLLVDAMNRSFRSVLVQSAAGGSQGGGATLTALGENVLAQYRVLQTAVESVLAQHEPGLACLLAEADGDGAAQSAATADAGN